MQYKADAHRAPKIRKQFFIDREQSRRLKARAAELGVSEAELVREGIERVLDQPGGNAADWRQRLKAVLDESGPLEGLARRVEQSKSEQAARWQSRSARTRRQPGER